MVSDADLLDHAIKAFAWLMPGEIRVFDLDDSDTARGLLTVPDHDAGD